jgi:hypothetical protein
VFTTPLSVDVLPVMRGDGNMKNSNALSLGPASHAAPDTPFVFTLIFTLIYAETRAKIRAKKKAKTDSFVTGPP